MKTPRIENGLSISAIGFAALTGLACATPFSVDHASPQELVLASSQWQDSKSCADIYFTISNDDDSAAIRIYSEIAAPKLGDVIVVDLSENPEALEVKYGKRLTIDACDDTVDSNNKASVSDQRFPVSGKIHFEITSERQSQGMTYKAKISVEDVRFDANESGVSASYGEHVFGWFAG